MVIDHIPQYVFWKDSNSRYLGCNANYFKAAGYDNVDEIISKTDFDLPWSKEEAEFQHMVDRRIMDNDAPEFRIQETRKNADGTIMEMETNKIPLHGPQGNVIGILGTYEDVTECNKAKKC